MKFEIIEIRNEMMIHIYIYIYENLDKDKGRIKALSRHKSHLQESTLGHPVLAHNKGSYERKLKGATFEFHFVFFFFFLALCKI